MAPAAYSDKMGDSLRRITQIGVVVSELDKAVEAMENVFGARPDRFLASDALPRTYRGRQVICKTRIALYHFANIEIELVEPVSAESVWSDYLKEKGCGVQHIKFSVSDFDRAGLELESSGYLAEMTGDSELVPGLKWAYFDTQEDIGFSVEIFNDSPPPEH